jgi:aminopeptidase
MMRVPARPARSPRRDAAERLRQYADLAVRIGLNVQPGQRLLVIGPIANGGVSLDAAPLVRQTAESAYRAGASLVEVLWGDEALLRARVRAAPRASFDGFSAWLPEALVRHVEAGHAVLSIYANDPHLLKDAPPDVVSALQQAASRAVRPFREAISRNATNWAVVAAPSPAWAARVFPTLAPARQMTALWDAIERLCRLDRPDPIAAWEEHLERLARRRDVLNRKRYAALRYRAPGTDLTIGLAPGHVWTAGQSVSARGTTFAPNLPTEEVFTMPHRERVDGIVRSTKPLAYGGTMIDQFTLRFTSGRIVELSAVRGETLLRDLVATDPGAARLGEVALVPHSSPVAQSGLLFYNTLFDENAATHVALGSAYKFTLAGGEGLDDEAFEAAGGNRSAVHVDFMIGSDELDVDGVRQDGGAEPLLRQGEWVGEGG